jgi:hypothetical protein
MGRQPGHDGTGSTPGPDPLPGGTPEPGPVPPPPRGAPGIPQAGPAGADSPSGFARGGQWDACAPSAALAVAAEVAAGPGWSCDGLTRDGMVGLLRQWQALESWAAAGKLGVLRALIREEDQPLPGGSYRGGLPEGWTKSLTHEVAAGLAVSVTSAENLMWLGWDLQARLPGTGELLAAGELTLPKARAIGQAFGPLTDEDTAAAEAMIIAELPGKTHSQVAALAAQAAITVDPDSARRRREEAERTRSRVLLFREESGAAALSGRDLPTDQALAAHARVCERAAEYNDCGVFGEARMDQLRATAYLDLINGTAAAARITAGQLATGTEPGTAGSGDPHEPGSGDLDRGPASGDPRSDDARGDDPGGGGALRPAAVLQIPGLLGLPGRRGRPGRPGRPGHLHHCRGWPTSCCRWPRCSALPNGPAKDTASARSTPALSVTWQPPSPQARGPGCASPSPTTTASRSATAAPDPHDTATAQLTLATPVSAAARAPACPPGYSSPSPKAG